MRIKILNVLFKKTTRGDLSLYSTYKRYYNIMINDNSENASRPETCDYS